MEFVSRVADRLSPAAGIADRSGQVSLKVEHQFYGAIMFAALESFNDFLFVHPSARGGHDNHKQAERQHSRTVETNNKAHAALSTIPALDSGGGSGVISIGAVTLCRKLGRGVTQLS
jgi:hypothetical protein